MSKEKNIQSEISGYISKILRRHFGKGPTSVYVTLSKSFIIIHFRGFLAPMEKLQVKQNEMKRVLETRDMIMLELKEEIIRGIKDVSALEVRELYTDWNLEKETGMFMAITEENDANDETELEWANPAEEQAFQKRIEEASKKIEKVPGRTKAYWLSDRMILIRRSGILVGIEKELIKNGYMEALKISKHSFEVKILKEAHLGDLLKRDISEIFIDWNFENDLSYTILLLAPEDSKGLNKGMNG